MVTSLFNLDGHLVARHEELARLDGALAVAGQRGGEYVQVSGVPGVGKSALLRAFGVSAGAHGALFAYGRFADGTRSPYAAVGEALDALVGAMLSAAPGERDPWRHDLSRELTASMAAVLATLAPAFGELLDISPVATEVADAADGRHRLQRVVARLLRVTARFRPVVLAIDDLQWADQDSLLLLSELRGTSIRNVLLIGAYRTGEFDPAAIDPSVIGPAIELRSLSARDVEALLSDVCGRAQELPVAAAEFHRRTGGNPLQVRQLLGRAQRDGAVIRPHATAHAVWDIRLLAAIEITSDSAEFFARAVGQLRPADRAILGGLACIGQEFDLVDAAAAVAHPMEEVAGTVWAALDLRLLDAVDAQGRRLAEVIDRKARYRFSHDRVSEAARAGLSEENRREVHLRIGRQLVERGDRLFDAARHLGIGGLALDARDAERAVFAEVQLRAAESARQRASFPLALDYSRAGLALLGARRWTTHPALTRDLQFSAAQAAYQVADGALLGELLDEASAVLAEPADRARITLLRMKSQEAEQRLQEAMSTGLNALDELGCGIARRAGKPRAAAAIVRMKLIMRRWTDERLMRLPRCEDARVIQTQLILGQLRNISYGLRPELFPLIVAKEIELTLACGLVPSSPIAITSFGVLLAASGDLVGCQRFGELGRLLTERPEFRDARPQVQFLYLNFIRHWRRPVHEGLPELRDAYRAALDGGDSNYAAFLAAVLLNHSCWVGRPLAEIEAVARSVGPEVRSERVPSLICLASHQYCLNLMGRTDDPFLLAGESGYDEREVLAAARQESDVVTLSTGAIIKLSLYFWSGDDTGGLVALEETARYLAGLTGTCNVPWFHMMNALIRIRVAPREPSTVRAVRRSLALHRRWAAIASENYASPCALIEGVWARARGDRRRAERHLDRAIALATAHQRPHIAALAQEEAGDLYAQTGRISVGRIMLRAAHETWLNLGLVVRSTRLESMHPWLLGRDLMRPGSGTLDPIATHRLMQALADAPTWPALAEALLGTVADTTGAARVLLFTGEPDNFEVRARWEDAVVTVAEAASREIGYDVRLLHEVTRVGRPVLTTGDGPGSERDRRPGPVTAENATLVVPVLMRGKTIGAIYAEHREAARGFGPGQQDALVAICAQAAAPLWNLEMEGRLRHADEHRNSLLTAQSRFIPAELLRILDLDDISRVRQGHRVERRMTVLMSDIRGYTSLLEGMSVAEASELTMGFLRAVELPIVTSNGLLQDVRGDEILAVFDTAADDAVRAGLAMLRALREHNRERAAKGSDELRVGIGVNTGVVGLGMVGGVNRMALTVFGDSVNLTSRVESATKRYGTNLLISDQAYNALIRPDRFDIRRMERVMVVNRSQPVTFYEVFDEDPEPLREAKRAARTAFDEAFALFDAGNAPAARAAFEQCRRLLPGDQVAPLHISHCEAVMRGDVVAGQPVALSQK
ncbi:MAG TPA: AAA family ATPase [Pseudonocardia sp.]|jgi:predicted ATPase/class 3 adenylate cyclase